jgi:hypothetical protein
MTLKTSQVRHNRPILRAHPNAERRRAYVEVALGDIVAAEIGRTETYALLNRLVQQGPFARAVINDALKRKHSLTRPYTGIALGFMLRRDGQDATHLAARLFESREPDLTAAVADGYAGLGTTLGAKDFCSATIWMRKSGNLDENFLAAM